MGIDKGQILDQIIKFIVGLLSKNEAPEVHITVPVPEAPKASDPVPPSIDWANPKCQITPHFTVEDACMLHSYKRLATEADGLNDLMKNLLIALCQRMELVRAILDCPMDIHCMYRSEAYNQSLGIKPVKDVHSMGLACDFDCGPKMTIDQVKQKLEPELAKLGMRMERGTTTWVHLDTRAPGPSGRYFTA